MVSLLVPCYNSMKYVGRLLDSILRQSYPAIEVIAVDDGSGDRTADVIEEYRPRFKERGYELKLQRQKHGGQSTAINNALKVMKGTYFAWPDSDDYYATVDSITRMVELLSETDETVGAVRCLPIYRDEKGSEIPGLSGGWGNLDKEWLFEDAVLEQNGFVCLSGGFIVKTEAFDRVVRGREIPTALNAGQNWQLLLPVLHDYRCLTLKERLHTVVVRPSSHSRGQYKTYTAQKCRQRDFLKVMIATLDGIYSLSERDSIRIKREFLAVFYRRQIWYANQYREWDEIKHYLSILNRLGRNIPLKERLKLRISILPGGAKVLAIIRNRRNKLHGKSKRR